MHACGWVVRGVNSVMPPSTPVPFLRVCNPARDQASTRACVRVCRRVNSVMYLRTPTAYGQAKVRAYVHACVRARAKSVELGVTFSCVELGVTLCYILQLL